MTTSRRVGADVDVVASGAVGCEAAAAIAASTVGCLYTRLRTPSVVAAFEHPVSSGRLPKTLRGISGDQASTNCDGNVDFQRDRD